MLPGFPELVAVAPATPPDLPGGLVPREQLSEPLLVLESVHVQPEPVEGVGEQLPLGDEPRERLHHELLARPEVVEDPLAENEEAAVDPHRRASHRFQPPY